MGNHAGADRKQEDGSDDGVLYDARGIEGVHGVRGRIQGRPSGAEQAARKDGVLRAALEERSGAQHRDTDAQGKSHAADGSHSGD